MLLPRLSFTKFTKLRLYPAIVACKSGWPMFRMLSCFHGNTMNSFAPCGLASIGKNHPFFAKRHLNQDRSN